MKRKIIKQGHNTLTMTLPSDWVKKFNLNSGDEIELSEKDNGLFITTEKHNRHKQAEFSIEGLDIPLIWKYFMAVYREGYDEILVKFNPGVGLESPYKFFSHHKMDLRYKKEVQKKTIVEALQGFVTRFIGLEIVEHGKDYIRIKEMGELTSKEFDNSLRRVFLLIQQMAEETVEAIKTNNPKILLHMHDVDINLDKFHDYCIRILNKLGNKETRKTSLLFATLYLLELLGDEFKSISFHLIEDFPKSRLNNVLYLAKAIKSQFDLYYDLFYKFDREKIRGMSEQDKKIYFSLPENYKKANEDEKEVFHHLRMIRKYINALYELRIEMEF